MKKENKINKPQKKSDESNLNNKNVEKKENKINKPEKKSDESNLNNKNLEDEIKKLKDIILNKENEIKKLKDEAYKYKSENEILRDEIKKLKDEGNKYKMETEALKNEIKKLKEDLLKSNKIINGMQSQNNSINNNEIKKLRDEIILLTSKLNIKDNEINDLKNNIKDNKIEKPKFSMDDIMVVTFMSTDSSVNVGIKCLATDVFAEVEEKLYKRFDDLRNTNNMFTVNARPVLRFKKMFENQIKDGDFIQLFKLE